MKRLLCMQTMACLVGAIIVCGSSLSAKATKNTQQNFAVFKKQEDQVVRGAKEVNAGRGQDILLNPVNNQQDLVFDNVNTRTTCAPYPVAPCTTPDYPQPCVPCDGPQMIRDCATVPVTTQDGRICMRRDSQGNCVPRTKKVCSVQIEGSCADFNAKDNFLRIKFSGVGSRTNVPQMSLVSLKFVGTIRFSSKVLDKVCSFSNSCLNYSFPVTFSANDLLVSPSMAPCDFAEANCAQKGASKLCDGYPSSCSSVCVRSIDPRTLSLPTRQALPCEFTCDPCCAVGETKPLLVQPYKSCFNALPFDPECDGQGGFHPLSLSVSFNACTNNANYVLLGIYPHADVCVAGGCNGGCFSNSPTDDDTCPKMQCDSTCPQPPYSPCAPPPVVPPCGNVVPPCVCDSIATEIRGTLYYTIQSSNLSCGGEGAVACVLANDACKPDINDCLCQLLECGVIDQCQFDCLFAALKTAADAGCEGGTPDLVKTLQTLMMFRSGMLRSVVQPVTGLDTLSDDVIHRLLDVLEQNSSQELVNNNQ